jgi:pimeloyl-ACP methyl ester carboxylesterase
MTPFQHYTSIEGYLRLMGWYDAELAQLTVPYEAQMIPTAYGATHVISAGMPAGLPVLLLHGLNINATVWRPQLDALAAHCRLIAPDVPGFAGKSAPQRIPYWGRAYADWLVDVLDQLQIPQALVVGSSAGGHFALKLAAYAPERVAGLLLLNPVGIVPFRGLTRLMRWQALVTGVQLLARQVFTTPEACRWVVERAMATAATEANVILTQILIHDYNRSHGPGPLTTDELAQVTAPVHLLVSDREIYTDNARLLARAQRVFARLSAELVHDCGHDINKEQPQHVNRTIRHLLTQLARPQAVR